MKIKLTSNKNKLHKKISKAYSILLVLSLCFQSLFGQNISSISCNGGSCKQTNLDNGIVVGQTKLYDERSFRIMLQNLERSLSALRLMNESALTNSYGRIQGGSLSTSSFGINVTGMPLPSVATTTMTGETNTSNVVTNQSATPSVVTTQNVVAPNTIQQVSTNGAVNPTIPNLPTQTGAFSTQQSSLMSQDLLAEQVSLQYQVMDLRLLLERSLTDRVFYENKSGGNRSYGLRSSAIVGFNVTLDPKPQYKDAVAEVEIVVDSKSKATVKNDLNLQSSKDNENRVESKPASLVMLLPRDKTYNVAAATKDAKQIGLGAVLQVINIGGSFGKTNESLYIVGDTDTVAFERILPKSKDIVTLPKTAITFGWQFRPVLGQRTVKSGMRQLYALMALPGDDSKYTGEVHVFTRWRKYDAKNKIVKDIIEGSETYKKLENLDVDEVFTRRLSPNVYNLEWQDVGNGLILLKVRGENFFDGINILAGNKMISNANDGLTVQGDVNFNLLIPAQTAAQVDKLWLIGKYGEPKVLSALPFKDQAKKPGWGLEIKSAKARPISPQNSKVEIILTARNKADKTNPGLIGYEGNNLKVIDNSLRPIVVVGGKVFGFSDAPLFKEDSKSAGEVKYSFTAPTQFLRDAGKLIVKELFQEEGYKDEKMIEGLDSIRLSSVSTLYANAKNVLLAITGGTFDKCQQIVVSLGENGEFVYEPDEKLFTQSTCGANRPPLFTGAKTGTVNWKSPSLITVISPIEYFKGTKIILVRQSDEDPVMMSLNSVPDVPEPVIDKQEKILLGMVKSVKLIGSNLTSISDITFEGESLKPLISESNTSLEITLNSRITASIGEKQINLLLKNGKVKNYILVVDRRD